MILSGFVIKEILAYKVIWELFTLLLVLENIKNDIISSPSAATSFYQCLKAAVFIVFSFQVKSFILNGR